MNFGGPIFVITIIAMSMGAWVFTTWLRMKHGYPLSDDSGNTVHRSDPDAGRKIDLLSGENERLTGRISRL